MLGFMNLSLDSWLVNWEQSLALTLLTGEEIAAGYYFRFDRDQLANVSPATRAEFYSKMRTAGAYSPNDIRRKENEPLISKEDGGDDYTNPNVATPKQAAEPPKEPVTP
jgi:phage portal protein BeeE